MFDYSFAQIGTGWLSDKIPPKFVLTAMGFGQLIFIYIASYSSNYNLLFIMLAGMIFVFKVSVNSKYKSIFEVTMK